MSQDSIRINKFLSEAGYCSRRQADALLQEGRITINGAVPALGEKVKPGDVVAVDGLEVGQKEESFIYLAFNKPVGIVCTTDTRVERNNIIDYINHPQRIFPVGRLDKDSQGLILLTNDGDIVNKILRAKNNHDKEYVVKVDKPLDADFARRMEGGIPILDTVTAPCKVKVLDRYRFNIILTQGLNRQIRRMCEYLGYEVKSLRRIRIMHLPLDVPVGQWRYLTDAEQQELFRRVEHSTKTFEG